MNFDFINQLISWVSIFGTAVFALSGALVAAQKHMDILGYILIGTVTGIGGGTLRDLLLGLPASWVFEPLNVYICIVVSAMTFFLIDFFRFKMNWIIWMDAIGLIAFAIVGTQLSLQAGVSPVIAVVFGVMSATFGGIIRDVLCAETLTLMCSEMYITCACLTAIIYVLLDMMGIDQNIIIIVSFIAGFSLRAAAIVFNLRLTKKGRSA